MYRTVLLSVALIVACLAFGCEKQGVSANPDEARTVLKQALEAWQGGEAAEAFKLRTNIVVADRRWMDGLALVSFDMPQQSDMNGYDWQCFVKTTVKTKDGKTVDEKTNYNVSTSPKKVVVRIEG